MTDLTEAHRNFLAAATLAQARAESWTELKSLPDGFIAFEDPKDGEDGPVIVFDAKGEFYDLFENVDEAEDHLEVSRL